MARERACALLVGEHFLAACEAAHRPTGTAVLPYLRAALGIRW